MKKKKMKEEAEEEKTQPTTCSIFQALRNSIFQTILRHFAWTLPFSQWNVPECQTYFIAFKILIYFVCIYI